MNRPDSVREEALERARAHSPFLRRLAEQRGEIVERFLADGAEAAIGQALAVHDEAIARRLRLQRGGLALAVALGDLAGELSLEQVTRHLSDFADRAIDQALGHALAERCEGAPLEGISVISLGKLGSRELNYSSDVDLILIFDPERLPVREGRDVAEEAVRIGQRFVKLLQERTQDGYVQRVDLRLRPAPEVTPIVLPVDAAISHYESQAMGWERAAFIRARVGGGDPVLGQRFLEAVQPFVWRRAIDFGAVEEIRSVGARIRAHYAEGQRFGPGYDLKRGRGGIREVEFYVQAQQLIHGGRAPELRVPATLEAIAALSHAGHFDQTTATVLADAYRDLRTAEHRVQMVDDRQTHDLPEGEEALANVASLAGADGIEAWLATLAPHTERIGGLFDELAGEERRLPRDAAKLERVLKEMGFEDPATASRLIGDWRTGKARSLRSVPARRAFEAMLPGMMETIGEAPHPNHALNRFADLVERLPSGINIYRLLEARQDLAQQFALILSLAPALADQLARRPTLFDGLVDRSALGSPGSAADMASALEEETGHLDYDVALDHARRTINERRFGVGVQLISGAVDPLEAARRYAVIAEGAVRALAGRTLREFELMHGRFADGAGLVILGLGRLGGEALTHASDLDIIFLYDAPEGQSNGPRPLGPRDYYNRLASRVSSALSVPTAAGPLYEVDTRLRPEGKQGPLAVSIDAFLDYQRSDAWTWEHMAMARARPVFGSEPAARKVMDGLEAILCADRDAGDTLEAVQAMRRQMREHKPPKGPLDLKLSEGGLVDLEFGIHARQLIHGDHFDPHLERALDALVAAGLAPQGLVEDHRLLTRALVAMRLVAPDDGKPSRAARSWLAQELKLDDWDAVLAALDAARQRVAEFWQSTGETT